MGFELRKLPPFAQLALVIGFIALALFLLGLLIMPPTLEYIAKIEQQDAVGQLKSICIAELKYYQKNSRYTDNLEELDYAPKGIYTYFLGRTVRPSSDGKVFPLPGSVRTFVNTTGFTAVAVTNLDEDLDLDVWTVDEKGVVTNVYNDFNKHSLKNYPSELRQFIMKKNAGGN